MTGRLPLSPVLAQNPVIAVLRASHASEYAPVLDALVAGGVRSIELTLTTQGVLDELAGLRTRFSDVAEIGVGTVTTVEEAERAIDAGAEYLVTPVTYPEIVEHAVQRGIAIYPGGLTPTELHTGWRLGATAVKLFPASAVGPSYIGQLRGPFPDLAVIPSGGVAIDTAPDWIEAGAVAVSLGGPLIGDAFKGGDLGLLRARAHRVSRLVAEAVALRASRR
ncbi:bifunctional 4-hydroxy-2-oxoglutarate aldolase/2-dehydro-3-deoxy-phosphogluconate aldolase [Sinomonas gamaensis]|jgi:2-dehydro-3-deoxyphosphogluconate aldolase/(4S)-4-hydroxy-2-oxoglutarate aldolase|uniref:bifunctional 4-hydroxy-2-oxoglutarate aldolase/2-dehydro-3-deoxy-phosphogluconate aldolase n=1 Tax=Sinomonas gamaensis TaxID=2565624 RepID=UPI0011085941|nr:bifunctional 4-hydroxy-2-oxoglutarate aldolase/2-dehydro-3-deoxy-phosphogluconate aldolase [Sinomonas gamaensis]